MERRDFLKLSGLSGLAVAGLAVPLRGVSAKSASALADRDFPRRYVAPFVRPKVLRPYARVWDDRGEIHRYSVTERAATAQILSRLSTPVHAYNGLLPGPTINVDQGVRVELRVRNALPATNPLSGASFATSTHLHGSASLPQYDGYANDLTAPGQYKTYRYPDFQDARTLWYHDHGVHLTAPNVYAGLAAQYHLRDPHERKQLPQGEFDVPIVLSDAMFAADGRLAFDDDDHSGLWGDVVLVNGVPWPLMKVKRRVYRFRILNASISRSYRPRLSTGEPMTIVATDGGLVPWPQAVKTFRHSPAERYEVLVDFRRYTVGTLVDLLNGSNENNVDYDHTGKIMRFQVTDAPFDGTNNEIPSQLQVGERCSDTMRLTPADAVVKRRMRVHRDDVTDVWLLSDVSWQDVVDSGFTKVFARPALGSVEQWEIENRGGGWFHPLHIHLVDFKVVGRNTNGGQPFPWEKGPKDVVYVGESETVKLLMRFDVGPHGTGGRYMIHCHNLPHEDHDMMTQFQVGSSGPANDPITAAPAVRDDLPADVPSYEPPVAALGW